MTACFDRSSRVEAPIERVFDLALSVDLHKASMAASNERAVGGVTRGRIGLGEEFTRADLNRLLARIRQHDRHAPNPTAA